MSEYLPVVSALLGAIVGGIIGFASAYFIQRQRFKREDEKTLFENVYGIIYPMLKKAKMRHQPDEFKQWPGEFWLSPPEIIEIEKMFASYSKLIPKTIHKLWIEAMQKGPEIMAEDADAKSVLLPFDLEKMYQEIENEIRKYKPT